jgi:DNA-binding CsgD family transcriptional regulator
MLSADDFSAWNNALNHLPDDSDGCMEWVTSHLKVFFPFERVFMAHGVLLAGEIAITHWQADGHSKEFLEQQSLTFELAKRGALAWWLENRKPFFIDPISPPDFASQFEIDEIFAFGLGNVAAHGALNLRANVGTYVSFAGIPEPLSDWHLYALRILTPALSELYVQQLAKVDVKPQRLDALSARQQAIIRKVIAGQSDKSIARDLGIAAQTVKNQMTLVYQKLAIQSRSQLIVLFR